MQIDLFTFVAQIVNFLILMFVLRALLYKRILGAMDERQQRIESDLRNAEQKREEADAQAEEYRRKERELEENRRELMDRAREEADEKRKQMIQEAREAIDKDRKQWQESLEQEKEAFLSELRRKTASQLCAISRKSLADMADEELEDRVVSVFLNRLERQEGDELRELVRSADGKLTVRSAFSLEGDRRERLEKAVRQYGGDSLSLSYATDEQLVCGVELDAAGKRLGWSMDRYVETLERELTEALSEPAGRRT